MFPSTVIVGRAAATRARSSPRSWRRQLGPQVGGRREHDPEAALAEEPSERPVAERQHREAAREVLEQLVRKRRVDVRAVQVSSRSRPSRSRTPAAAASSSAAGSGSCTVRPGVRSASSRYSGTSRTGRRPASRPSATSAREDLAQVVVAAVRRERSLVDEPRRPRVALLARGSRRQVVPQRVVREDQRSRRAAGGGARISVEQLVRDGRRARRFPRSRGAPARAGRPARGSRPRTASGAGSGGRGRRGSIGTRPATSSCASTVRRVRQVVAVDEVRLELLEHGGERAAARRLEAPQPVEELVAGAVPLGQRLPLVGEAELEAGQRRAQAHGDLERADAGLLLQEEDSHRRA